MKPNELQELRDWAAEVLMNWREGLGDFWIIKEICSGQHTIEAMEKKNWKPDEDLNQAFMLVEKMRVLGWAFKIWVYASGENYCAEFTENTGVTGNITRTKIFNSSPALAILLAAKATEVEPCGISGSE